ncbi:hypothetical protein LTR85_007614 [Meristemomyces frigidus]|nr:hypothetical protein LTR85_007614 [Meristemomyces frigidus]
MKATDRATSDSSKPGGSVIGDGEDVPPQACTRVLGTAELLEMILLRLPMKDLLFAHAVCRQWKSTIDDTARLQQALFFRSATPEPVEFHYQEAYVNSDGVSVRKGYWATAADGKKPVRVSPNALYAAHQWPFLWIYAASWQAKDLDRKDIEAFLRPEASWRRMLVAQPPPRKIYLYRNHPTSYLNGGDGTYARVERGIEFPYGVDIANFTDTIHRVWKGKQVVGLEEMEKWGCGMDLDRIYHPATDKGGREYSVSEYLL